MGIFLTTTYEARYAGTEEKNKLKKKVISYITHNLYDHEWQDSISEQIRKLEKQYHHITFRIVLRLFDVKDIEEGNLKSYARYKKKEDKLVIDQMLVLNDYADLSEDEMRIKMCDEVFEYAEKMLLKYKDRFKDFDVIKFIPLLKERIEDIKAHKFEDKTKEK